MHLRGIGYGNYILVSDDGMKKLTDDYNNYIKEQYSKPEKYVKGMLYTILILTVFQAIWYLWADYNLLIALLMPLMSFSAYKAGSVKVTAKGYISIYLLTFISTLAVSLYRWTKTVYGTMLAESGKNYITAFKEMLSLINESGVRTNFYFEMIFIIAGLGILSPFFYKKYNNFLDNTIDMNKLRK